MIIIVLTNFNLWILFFFGNLHQIVFFNFLYHWLLCLNSIFIFKCIHDFIQMQMQRSFDFFLIYNLKIINY